MRKDSTKSAPAEWDPNAPETEEDGYRAEALRRRKVRVQAEADKQRKELLEDSVTEDTAVDDPIINASFDPILEQMRRLGYPLTREVYAEMCWPDLNPDELPAELASLIPEVLK